jgi:hypothetical protein
MQKGESAGESQAQGMQEKTSRLAGTGGAAESALMNAQTRRRRRKRRGFWGGVARIHRLKFTSNFHGDQTIRLLV